MIRPIATALALLIATPVSSETVDVKYRGTVDLKPFACTDTPRSSFVQRVCYDKAQSYMLINLNGTFYHYCELPLATFDTSIVRVHHGACIAKNQGYPQWATAKVAGAAMLRHGRGI